MRILIEYYKFDTLLEGRNGFSYKDIKKMFKKAIKLRKNDYDGFAELFCKLYGFKIISKHTESVLDVGFDLILDIDTDLMLRGNSKHWRQINVVMSKKDEALFDMYLRQNFEFTYIKTNFNSLDDAYLKTLNISANEQDRLYVWNKKFKFTPRLHPFSNDSSKYYLDLSNSLPLVEFQRCNSKNRRFYGSLFISIPNGKDIVFTKRRFVFFYKELENWIKKNSSGYILLGAKTYFLPDAWAGYLENPDKYL